ncbi:unnamed protein product [Mycena citricolor]|uniref:Thioesterase domain-containing protein n=1 Tax=Mycena citricolor TaxID=2018698 RepID=A0AAD2HYD7_9AGAR|nr:unnamed protein product [Mycena citricolor]
MPLPHRSRALSVALVAAARGKPAPLLDLPTELSLEIVELSLLETHFNTLAAVSQAFNALVSFLLYRRVRLDTAEQLQRFHATTRTKSREFLESHVKALVVTVPQSCLTPTLRMQLAQILTSCCGLRAVFVTRPGALAQSGMPSCITECCIRRYDPVAWTHAGTAFAQSVTHVRTAEPGEVWASPLSIMSHFGWPPRITHFALARRADANEENDAVFAEEVAAILVERPALKMLVVSIFPSHWPRRSNQPGCVEDSSIWKTLSLISDRDSRLVVQASDTNRTAEAWLDAPGSFRVLSTMHRVAVRHRRSSPPMAACLRYTRRVWKSFLDNKGTRHDTQCFPNLQILNATPGLVNASLKVEPYNLNRVGNTLNFDAPRQVVFLCGSQGCSVADSTHPVHGGLILSLTDTLGSLAVASKGHFMTGVSTDIGSSFCRPAGRPGDVLHAKAQLIAMGKQLAYTRVEFTNPEGVLLAYGYHTKYVGKSGSHPNNVSFTEDGERVVDGEDLDVD